jgi:hypothetical protein
VTATYDYLFLTLRRAPSPHTELAMQMKAAAPALAVQGGEVIGQFASQLGWAGNEAAVLLRWSGPPGDADAASSAAAIAQSRIEHLTPTIRPTDDALPSSGGIYVHRWFEMDAGAVDEFVAISAQGWRSFETLFDARIFGLFRAAATDADRETGAARLLLITRYGSHGVWEDSRDPSTEAMQLFIRRQQLTRRSWAASTRLVTG